MFKKQILAGFHRLGYDVSRLPSREQKLEEDFIAGGAVPYSRGYVQAKHRTIDRSLNDVELLARFQQGAELPQDFGISFDERCVEFPWAFAHLSPGTARILDAGSVLNHHFIVDQPLLKDKHLHIVTLAPEPDCFWQKGFGYLYEDLRQLPIQDDYYDTVICISTLEHVGLDNSNYSPNSKHVEAHTDDFVVVMRELRRVLKPDGALLLTVPFGRYQNLGHLQQFDRALLTTAIEAFSTPSRVTETFYRYTSTGWQIATDAACRDATYVESMAKAWQEGRSATTVPPEPDKAVAARAVACVKLVKAPCQ